MLFEPQKKWERISDEKTGHFGSMYGRSQAMSDVFSLLGKVARTDLSCILVGETGTGKELAARGIHDNSDRAAGNFIVIDCGAVSKTLIESELFGHEKGAFTGADRQRVGAFEASDGGTIFLDEIGELSIDLQPKLLRALERREVKRLGSVRHLEIDVRVVAATHRDLHDMIKKGEFREDLYYRLAEVVVELPPLRDRREDVGVIAQRIFEEFAAEGGGASAMSVEAVKELEARLWPGNVRELRNVLRRAMAMCATGTIEVADLNLRGAERMSSRPPPPIAAGAGAAAAPSAPAPDVSDNLPIKEARERWVAPMERAYLERLVRRCQGDLDRAS
ncbi:MAG: sigma-54-dependent Fis family transcriptional regulator, partial [Deltaproteobacteria bacterium]|nr:sigma-54-dependent Fis family transcriptional regulator [Deltaproteobacteria bacterium]